MIFLRGEVGGLNDFRMEDKNRDAVAATPAGGLSRRVVSMCVGGCCMSSWGLGSRDGGADNVEWV